MTFKRWLLLISVCVLLLITVSFIYFRDVQNPQWSAIKAAKEQATEAAGLAEISEVSHHIWQKDTWIVEGTDEQGEEVFVFLSEGQLLETIKSSDSISKKAMKNAFMNEKPKAVVKRIQPGVLDDKPVWEIYYTDGEEPQHYRYDFYRFDDGAFIDSYKLPAKTGP